MTGTCPCAGELRGVEEGDDEWGAERSEGELGELWNIAGDQTAGRMFYA